MAEQIGVQNEKSNMDITNDKTTVTGLYSHKRRSEDSNSIAATKAKRATTTVNRLGICEFNINDDEFFDHIDNDQQKNGDRVNNSVNVTLNSQDESVNEKNNEKTFNGQHDDNRNNAEKTTNEIHTSGNQTPQPVFSPGEKVLYQMMLELMAELKVVQKGQMELTSQVSKHATKENVNENCLKRLKRNELVKLGLPLENITQMKNFESKLKDDEFFNKSVNEILFNFMCVFDNI